MDSRLLISLEGLIERSVFLSLGFGEFSLIDFRSVREKLSGIQLRWRRLTIPECSPIHCDSSLVDYNRLNFKSTKTSLAFELSRSKPVRRCLPV